jgi:uncharacterized protein YwgA
MTPQKRLKIAQALAAVLKISGTLAGRVRVQKVAYLLQQKGMHELADVEFEFHHYGPYSEEVASVLSQAVDANIIVEKTVSFDDEWQRFEYTLSPRGSEYVAMVGEDSMSLIKTVVSETVDQHWRTLELAATVLFFQKRGGLGMTDAMSRSLSMKPACHGHEQKAATLLTSLQLA